MATHQFGFKPAAIGTSASASLTDTRVFRGTANVLSLNTIPLVHQVQSGQRIKQAFAAGRAANAPTLATAKLCIYETDSAGLTQTALVMKDILVTTTIGTVAWYSATGLDIDLSPWTGKYIKIGIQSDGGQWRRCNVAGGLSGDMVSASSGGAPDPFGSATNQTSLHPMYLVVEDGPAIVSVNGGEPLMPGIPASISTLDFSSPINAATIDGVACSNVSGGFLTPPVLLDGQQFPRPGSARTLVVTNGTQSASKADTPVGIPEGYTATELSGTLNLTQVGALYNLSPAAVVGDFIIHPSTHELTPAGLPRTNEYGRAIFWHLQASTKIARAYYFVTGVK